VSCQWIKVLNHGIITGTKPVRGKARLARFSVLPARQNKQLSSLGFLTDLASYFGGLCRGSLYVTIYHGNVDVYAVDLDLP